MAVARPSTGVNNHGQVNRKAFRQGEMTKAVPHGVRRPDSVTSVAEHGNNLIPLSFKENTVVVLDRCCDPSLVVSDQRGTGGIAKFLYHLSPTPQVGEDECSGPGRFRLVGSPERVELGPQPVGDELEEALLAAQAFEPMFAEVDETATGGLIVLDDPCRGAGQQDLTAAPGAADSRGPVYRYARVAGRAEMRLASVNAHPHAELFCGQPGNEVNACWASTAAATASRALVKDAKKPSPAVPIS